MFILYPLQSEHIEAIQYSFIKLKQIPVFALSNTFKALSVIFHYAPCKGLFFLHLHWCLMKGDTGVQHLGPAFSFRNGGDWNGLLEERGSLRGRIGAQLVIGLLGTQLYSCRPEFSIARAL